ncbi:DRC11 protein, partial [Polyodon spathula]|nr:DRC11 protein [Polyodon spathula]
SAYGKIWVAAQGALEDLIQKEIPAEPPRPQKDQQVVFHTLATFYVKYVQILRSMEAVYDQIVHPQKRRVIWHVLEGVMGRVLELKSEMVDLEFSEFHYYDDILQDLKLTPEDIEIPIPRYFVSEKIRVLKNRERILAQILTRAGQQELETKVNVKLLSLEEAVRLIQVSERARQGRLRAKFMKEIRLEEEKEQQAKIRGVTTLDPDEAATRIQKVWRGYSQRKRTKKERLEEMIFLGMVSLRLGVSQVCPANVGLTNGWSLERSASITRQFHMPMDLQNRKSVYYYLYYNAVSNFSDATGKFPDYPDEEDGGSAAIFAEKTPEQVAAELAAKEEEKEKKKSKGKKDKKSGKKEKKKDKKGKGKGKKGKGDKEEEEQGWKMAPSNFLPTVVEGSKSYKDVWQGRDEGHNFSQRFDGELIKEEKRKEVEEEIRVQVDELMRQELKNLKLTVDREKGKKKKGKKGGKKKKKKGKKGGKKKKKEKDLTADRTIESLYEELVQEGLLIRPSKTKLADFIGEYSYLGTTLRQADIEPMPSLSDIRQLMALYGILPLGSQAVHEKAPLMKTLLLAGPAGVGKKMLVHALCTETGANLFNLSSANIAGKYPGKTGLQMMLHMVFKVARQLQPSVVWIGEAEKTFYKKVPKAEKEMEPKRLKKDLPKLLKSIKAEDRVLIVGTTRRPFDADLKPFCKVYKKILLIPRPDYSSRLALWSHVILQNRGLVTSSLDLSSLAKITDGYTQGHMMRAVQAVLTDRRVQLQGKKPLSAVEFISPLARQDPIYKEEEEAFK